ncbi:hypothetical protein [Noviherbaspirillum malthae]|uniref:hypothetical protein n=1 Tax=Noviherbaspirillum malthae TaxID=1260987 RepID=UPI00188E7330|nr:hypothetical protein [Noviherbaspirillum malthae]
MKKQNQQSASEDFVVFVIGSIIGGCIVGAVVMVRIVVFLVAWLGKKAVKAPTKIAEGRREKPQPEQLPTPDIFKGMANLAPAKEMNLRKL